MRKHHFLNESYIKDSIQRSLPFWVYSWTSSARPEADKAAWWLSLLHARLIGIISLTWVCTDFVKASGLLQTSLWLHVVLSGPSQNVFSSMEGGPALFYVNFSTFLQGKSLTITTELRIEDFCIDHNDYNWHCTHTQTHTYTLIKMRIVLLLSPWRR